MSYREKAKAILEQPALDWEQALATALRDAVMAERSAIMKRLGYDVRGEDLTKMVAVGDQHLLVTEDAAGNLLGALADMEGLAGDTDPVTIATVRRVYEQIHSVVRRARREHAQETDWLDELLP